MINFIKEIETKYNVSSVTINGTQVWPFLRIAYYSAYESKYKFNKEETELSLRTKIKRVKNIFYGFFNLFKKYDYFIFSNTLEKRLWRGKYIDKIAESLITELGKENTCVIENPVEGKHFKRSLLSAKNIISLDLFSFFSYMLSKAKHRFIINNEFILKEIEKKYRLDIDYQLLIKKFFNYVRLFIFFYRIFKPRAIFVSCYYSLIHQAALYAAKKENIKRIELQHGIINNRHPAYNIFIELDRSCFPNYLLCFGDYVKNNFNSNNYFISPENIFSVGNAYIEYINNFYKGEDYLFNLIKKYRKSVTITSQYTIEDKLINFLKKAALKNSSILYIFIPRFLNRDYSSIHFPSNVIIFKELDFYKIVKYTDFHSTVYSTCALEAPALGTPNILINIDNLAREYYADILCNEEITKFVDSPDEFTNLILNLDRKNSVEIRNSHSSFYAENHAKRVKEALNKIFKDSLGH